MIERLKQLDWRRESQHLLRTWRDWPWWDTLLTLRDRFREDRLSLTASSLTFTTLISLVPLITVMLALFSAFPVFGRFKVALQEFLLQNLVPDGISKPVMQALTRFSDSASHMGAAGLVLLVLAALALVLTIDRTLNSIWRVRKPRPFAQRILVYWAAITLGPLLVGASMSSTSLALTSARGLVRALPGGVAFLLDLLQFALMWAAVTGLFKYVPNTHVRWSHALAGSLFVALAWELAKMGLAWYLRAVPTVSIIYGAFATVPIMLLWVYLAWVIVLLGAVIAAYAPSLQMRLVRPPDVAGGRFAMALSILSQLRQARAGAGHGLSLLELARRLRADPLVVEPIIDRLQALDWVGVLDEGGDKRWVLTCEPAQTPVQPLVEALLLRPGPATAAFEAQWQRHPLTLAEALGA